MFCAKCGHPLKDGAKFCTNCGAMVNLPPAGAARPEANVVSQPSAESARPEANVESQPAAESAKPEANVVSQPTAETSKPEANVVSQPTAEAAKPEANVESQPAAESAKPEANVVGQLAAESARPEANIVSQPAAESARSESNVVSQPAAGTAGSVTNFAAPPVQEQAAAAPAQVKRRKKKPWIAVIAVLLVAALTVGGVFTFRFVRDRMQYSEAMSDALESMEDGMYSDAISLYKEILEIRPDSEEAKAGLAKAECALALQNAAKALKDEDYEKARDYYSEAMEKAQDLPRSQDAEDASESAQYADDAEEGLENAALALAKQYLAQENFAQAAGLLEDLDIKDDSKNYQEYEKLLSAAKMDPEILEVSVDSFPVISVTLSCGSELTADEIAVTEGGLDRTLRNFKIEDGRLTLSYESDDVAYESQHREFTVTLKSGDFAFQRSSDYDTPHFEQANIKFVSSDVSAYPVVRAYFRVEKQSDSTTVEDLDINSFRIQERLEGGAYLAREIRSVAPLENMGLNIDLVADKSSSIELNDMNRIKDVMIQFVNNLHYDAGDKAEVLAFDDIVQQMCCFTDDPTLLTNGINNMSTDGLTALYDAIYCGVQNAALQGGARCVIAFTDGMDVCSVHTAEEVINYANTNQVPVYIIGVGYSVEEYVLKDIAARTGGRYWFIDDLYDLREIFDQVYEEQKELYVVEYVSDPDADPYARRDIETTVTGGGYKGDTSVSFTPAFSVQGLKHDSRYELVAGTCTWEEANRRCQEMGGHLATITSQDELDQIIALAEQNDCKYVWLGGYTSYDAYGNVFGHWVTGENFSFQAWGDGQPSREDLDGTPEWYIMLWYVHDMWRWNDQRNDPAAVSKALNQNMCFICEYEE